MLVKAGIAAVVLVCAALPLSQIDYRDLYNEMYPVNGLKRDVLNLCHEAKPTFVRALKSDRVGCYDSMPTTVELAIGWVRTSSRLAAMNRTPTAVDLAERLLVAANGPRPVGPVRFTGYLAAPVAAHPCEPAGVAPMSGNAALALGEPDPRLRSPVGGDEEATLRALGVPRLATVAEHPGEAPLPLVSLATMANEAGSGSSSVGALDRPTPLDVLGAPGLGDNAELPARMAVAGCRTAV